MELNEPEFREILKKIPYRHQYVGWFVATIFLSILVHVVFFILLALNISEILTILLFFVCTSSLSGISYFGARAFTTPENILKLGLNWRLKATFALFAGYTVLFIVSNTIGISDGSLYFYTFGAFILIAFYGSSLIIGWDIGRSNVTLDNYKHQKSNEESKILHFIEKKSRSRAFSFLIITLLISGFSGAYFGWDTGFGTFVGIYTFVDVILKIAGRID